MIATAIVLGPRLYERLQQLTLIDTGTDSVYFGVWEILGAFAWITGVLAAVVLVLALIVGFGAADLYGRFVIERLRERLRDNYDNHELNAARDGRRVAEQHLAKTRLRLKTERGQRARYRRSMRAAERERDRMLSAVAAERRRAATAPPWPSAICSRGAVRTSPHPASPVARSPGAWCPAPSPGAATWGASITH